MTAAFSRWEALAKTKKQRDPQRVQAALQRLARQAESGENLMAASIECAHARVTTGEWSETLRQVFGQFRPPTGIEGQAQASDSDTMAAVRQKVEQFIRAHGYRPKIVVGKPGLDGHSNGAEMIAVAARNAGFDVVYFGIRLSVEEIVQSALEENVDVIGLSILSGSHNEIVQQLLEELDAQGARGSIPVVLGGIIPVPDRARLMAKGIQRIFTPEDFDPVAVMGEILDMIDAQKSDPAVGGSD
jgi:(2R)-ethylmalonyl-CoA mutase